VENMKKTKKKKRKKKNKWIKLAIYARKIWWLYDEERKICLVNSKGKCQNCKKEINKLQVDHKQAVGQMPTDLGKFCYWLERLFCETNNLQALCKKCHVEKTKSDKISG